MKTIEELKKRLAQLEEEIAETKKRLPAHSTKPPVMMDLLALEDEYDDILAELEKLKGKASRGGKEGTNAGGRKTGGK